MAKTIGRTQPERRAEAEERMVNAVVEILSQRGFGALSLGEIGAKAGYSANLPLHHFGSKEALVALAAEKIIGHYSALFHRAGEGQTGLAAIQSFVRMYLRYPLEHPAKRRALVVIMAEAAVNEALRVRVAKLTDSGCSSVAAMIRAGQDAGEIEPMIDADIVGRMILGWLRGLVSLWAENPDTDLGRLGVAMRGAIARLLRDRSTGEAAASIAAPA